MLFLTYWFVLFICVTFPIYWVVRWPRFRLALLCLSCAVFHTHFAGPAGVVPIVVLGVITYLAGLSRNRTACAGGILLAALSLVFYKYTKFLCLDLLGCWWYHGGHDLFAHVQPLLPERPPLAVSFFVFEFVHYLFEVRRGKPPLKSPLEFCLFSIFWPSIVAGPVKRFEQFIPALKRGVRSVSSRHVAIGIILVAVGLLKKVVADNLTAYVAYYGPRFEELTPWSRWCVFLAIGLRILWDFSGYSDMAIGFARMFGIKLPANFNWPYLAMNLADFWHRWHISLSTWIRDYIYIPIGGSRHGVPRKVFTGLVAFGICGLWHGAGLNFLFWGLYHGAGLAVCSNYRGIFGRVGRAVADWFACNRIAGRALTLLFVNVGWLFFFYPLPVAFRMLELLFGG